MPIRDSAVLCIKCKKPGTFYWHGDYQDKTCRRCRLERAKHLREVGKPTDAIKAQQANKRNHRPRRLLTLKDHRQRDLRYGGITRHMTIEEKAVRFALMPLRYSLMPQGKPKRVIRQALMNRANGRCEICCRCVSFDEAWIDHEHATDLVRGILCPECNHGLGQFKDDIENLRAAVRYLLDNESVTIGELGDDVLAEYLHLSDCHAVNRYGDAEELLRADGIIGA